MDSIVANLMNEVMTGDNLSTISKSVGGDEKGVQSALQMGLPMIMGALADTSTKPGGADMITKMLGQMGGTNPMDNLGSYLGSPAASGGSGILSSLLGSQMGTIQTAIAQKTGLPPAVVGSILSIAAPMVLGYVGKMFTGQGNAGLAGLLGEQSKMAMQTSPDAAAMAGQIFSSAGGTSGIMGMLKKVFGK